MFCAIATTIDCCKTESVVDVFQVVKAQRIQKPGLVLTVVSICMTLLKLKHVLLRSISTCRNSIVLCSKLCYHSLNHLTLIRTSSNIQNRELFVLKV